MAEAEPKHKEPKAKLSEYFIEGGPWPKGPEYNRVMFHQAVEVPKGTVESSVYKVKGVKAILDKAGGTLCCEYKDQRFEVPVHNILRLS